MKKLPETLLLCAVFAGLLCSFAFAADVAPGPFYAVTVAIPAIIIAVAAFVVVLAVRAARKKKAARRGEDKKDE
jgi:large-conductance mechanosensitive channel